MLTIHFRCFHLALVLVVWLSLNAQQTHAATLALNSEPGHLSLSSQFDLLEDKSASLQIRDILQAGEHAGFKPLKGNLNASYSKSVFWLRLQVQRSDVNVPRHWLLEMTPVMLDDIRLYVPAADGTLEEHRAGDRLPFSALEIQHHYPSFSIHLPDTAPHTVYLRIASTSAIFLRADLWTPIRFAERSNLLSNMMGAYYGIMLAMIVYNLLLTTSYRDRSMLYYLLLSTATLIAGMTVNGHMGMYIAPDWPWLVDILPGLIQPLITLFVSLFIGNFLHLSEKMPRIYVVFRLIQAFCLFAILLILLGLNQYIAPAIQIAAFIQMLLVLPICLLAGIRGYRPGYIVFAASSVWIVGALLITLRNLGIVQPSWLTDYGFQLGSALEVILLALAQAERISIIKKEHAKAQEQLLAISQRTEQELDAEVRQRTSELADAVTRLQKLDKEKNEFLGIAAHDLKNPLTGIIGMSALLQKMHATLSEEQQSDYLQRISKNGQRMMHIISNLLDVNALETGQPHIRLEAIDLGQAARDVIQHYQETLAAKDLQLEVAVQEHILIRADQNTTIQLLDNLISNAIKYSPLGKHIWLSVSRHDNFGQFSIRDEGPGLSRQDQEHLFEKFVRLSSLPTAGEHSSGLGLFIVKKLSEALGGGVRCDSVPGQGCTFTVDIPLANAD